MLRRFCHPSCTKAFSATQLSASTPIIGNCILASLNLTSHQQTTATVEQVRQPHYLYTSYDSREGLKSFQIPKRHVPRSKNQQNSLRAGLKSKLGVAEAEEQHALEEEDQAQLSGSSVETSADVVQEEMDKDNQLMLQQQEGARALSTKAVPPLSGGPLIQYQEPKPYVPLDEVSQIELKGDYLMEGGLFEDALRHYGIAAKAFKYAYADNPFHNMHAKIGIKLSRAFRATGRLESSRQNLERVLHMLESNVKSTPILDYCIEALLELGLTKEALGEADAPLYWEDCLILHNKFHDIGESHRLLRKLHRLERRFSEHAQEKYQYNSPYSRDRVFALVEQALGYASDWYEKAGEKENQLRVLEDRIKLIDRKFWNMRDTAGRIRRFRGHSKEYRRHHTPGPTVDELFTFSPTLHQPYRDYKLENDAPVEFTPMREVFPGTNRKVIDDGDPYRHLDKNQRERRRRRGEKAHYDTSRFLKGD